MPNYIGGRSSRRAKGRAGGGGGGGGGAKGRGGVRQQLADTAACGLNATEVRRQIEGLPAYFMRHWAPRSVTFAMAQRTYNSLAGWGRTRFQVMDGKLYYPDLKHNTFGCVLRRTPILAWALLEMLERHPQLPDVDVPVNCRDKPGSQIRASGGVPELAFSYTTARAFSDVPLPDYTYWGLPYADLPPWTEWLARPMPSWEQKLDQMIWVGSPTNPLRQAFRRCATTQFGERLVHRMPDKEQMHELAWRCKPTGPMQGCPVKPKQWTPLEEQCRYKYILHLPGISDWLEHFKHQLACGSVNIFIGARPQWQQRLSAAAAAGELGPPRTFDHFDFSGPLLRQGQQFLFVPVGAGGGGGGGGAGVCKQLQAAMSQLEAVPERAKCIARAGQELSRTMDMGGVYGYMAGALREASARQQEGVARRVVRAENSRLVTKQNFFSFVPPAKRPWMEHIFVPTHRDRFNNTPFLPPRGAETSSGLFH